MSEHQAQQGGQTPASQGLDHGKTHRSDHGRRAQRGYLRFVAMVTTSTVTMFVLTYTNVFSSSHIRFSEERLYMALLMGSAMAIIMLGFMWRMYPNRAINLVIVGAALVLGVSALWLSRSQALVDDESYMNGMIPHHSIAILTSERAGIEDLRVRDLADGISQTQREEIAEMTWLVNDIESNGPATTPRQAEQRPVPDFSSRP
jgi:hypothetical protein